MKEAEIPDYNFTLIFALPDAADQPERHLDALYEAGCDDASHVPWRQACCKCMAHNRNSGRRANTNFGKESWMNTARLLAATKMSAAHHVGAPA